MRMHENSLFAILLRAPWWVSFLAAAAIGVPARYLLERFSVAEAYALFIALPFLIIGCVSGWRQLRAPSAAATAARLDALQSLSWEKFSAQLETAYKRQGYEVRRLAGAGAGADFELVKSGRTSLVACKRWKAARTGVEPLRELDAARQAREAHECIFVAVGEVSDNARSFAAKAGIRLLEGAGLTGLLPAD